MNSARKNNLIGSVMLTVCAIVWGSSFVAQTTGAEYVGPFTFIALRTLLGSISLLPVIFVMNIANKNKPKPQKTEKGKGFFFFGGIICGVCLCIASVLQQIGLDRGTSPGKAGFITALYILLVPIFSVALKKKTRPLIWVSVGISVLGLYLLCVTDNSIAPSDFFVLACAVCYAVHILIIDYVSPYVDGVKLSCMQFFVCGLIALVPMFISEEVSLELIKGAAPSILYSGIMSSGVAFTLQILGQQRMNQPTVASMLMSLESVFAVIFGIILLNQVPTPKEFFGCVLMFGAIILAQLPEKKCRVKPQD